MRVPGLRLISAPPRVAASLLVGHCHLFASPGAVLIGSDRNCGIQFDSPKLSTFHVQVSFEGETWRVKPLAPGGLLLNHRQLHASTASASTGARVTLPEGIELELTLGTSRRDPQREAQLLESGDNVNAWSVFADWLNEASDPLGEWMSLHAVGRLPPPELRLHGLTCELTLGCLRRVRLEPEERLQVMWLEQALNSPYARFLTDLEVFTVDDESLDDENTQRMQRVFELLLALGHPPPLRRLCLGFAFRTPQNTELEQLYAVVQQHCPQLATPFSQLVETRQNLTLHTAQAAHAVYTPSQLLGPDIVIRHRQARFVVDAPHGVWVNRHLRRHWTISSGDVLKTANATFSAALTA
jgi:FHA domain